ncbi:MAG: single-stranded DNA-binding protein, partial [Atopobiaceae bacterium]|nr:single-stranded DNA-binding protein [Atopobiaceae bacterium]
LHWSSWEKDGVKRSKVEVYVDEVEFLSSRNAQQQSSQQTYAPQQPSYSAPAPAPAGAPEPQQAPAPVSAPPTDNVYDEDIPF